MAKRSNSLITRAPFKGQVVLVVNVASKCGYTPQYKELQELYKTYMDDGLVLLGFPANNYGGQEPGTDKEIKEFCSVNFKVSFPMFSKISVKGDDIHPLFKYLTTLDNKDLQGDIKWNFEKFLIGRDGKLLQRFPSKVTPMSDEMQNAVKKALEK